MVLFLMMATYDSEGAMVQMGKPKSAGIAVSSLLYNEYIVYSLDQVRIKYLVQLVCACFLFSPSFTCCCCCVTVWFRCYRTSTSSRPRSDVCFPFFLFLVPFFSHTTTD